MLWYIICRYVLPYNSWGFVYFNYVTEVVLPFDVTGSALTLIFGGHLIVLLC